MLNVKNRGSNY